jgi:hypothetical protein
MESCFFLADLESELSLPSGGEGSYHSSGPRLHTSMPILEVGLHQMIIFLYFIPEPLLPATFHPWTFIHIVG